MLRAAICVGFLFSGVLDPAMSQEVQKGDPFPSPESVARAFAFPEGKIQTRDGTERANEKYDNKAIAAWVFTSSDKRFVPVNSVLAKAGTLLTPEISQKLETRLSKATEDGKGPAKRVSIGDAKGYAGMTGFGPGGFGVTVLLHLPSLNADLQITMNVPHDRDIPEEPELREYAAYLNGEKDFSLPLLQVTSNAVERVIQQKDRLFKTQVRPRSAAEHPDWKQLQQLLGKPIAAQEVVDFVKTHELKRIAKGDSGAFTAPHQSYSVMFRQNTVGTIVIQASPWPKGYGDADWTAYARPLPASLTPADGRKAVERKLGSPIDPGGDQWIHDELTIWVFFNKDESAIGGVYVWRTKDKP